MSGAKPDEQIRTPMQWSSEEGAGFTSGIPWEAINSDYRTSTSKTKPATAPPCWSSIAS